MDPILYEQIGSQLATSFKLFDNAIINPDAVRLSEYEKMLDTDETVAQGFDFLVLGVLIKLGEYEHKDQVIKDFINSQFEQMNCSLYQVCQEILSAIWAGFSVTEINYKLSDGKVGLDNLATYHPTTLYFNVDDKGRLMDPAVKQMMLTGNTVDIPKKKCIIYTHDKRFGNPYGRSSFRRVYKNWVLKDPILKMWARALDRFGTPLLVAMVPDGEINDPDASGKKIAQIDYVIRLLKDIQNQTALAMTTPNGDNKSGVSAVAGGSAGTGEAFNSAVGYLNKMIYRGLLLPSLVGDEGERSGSYSLGSMHMVTFQSVLDSIYSNLTETLLEQLVRRLIEYNFGPQDDYGSFPQRKVSESDKKLLAEVFGQMVDKGFLDPDVQADFDYVRTMLDMPERKVVVPAAAQDTLADYNLYMRTGGSDGKS